jgi:hypothetical protein
MWGPTFSGFCGKLALETGFQFRAFPPSPGTFCAPQFSTTNSCEGMFVGKR